ncbi:MAG TPA: GGDEF domain-containing protein [Symbiobacteriaceae bacterium]|nr:GGDEF domain-containing protein [Symbiobacteriaceae bacterium]
MSGFSKPALFLAFATITAATAVAIGTLVALPPVTSQQWLMFGGLTTLAALSYLYPIRLEGDEPVSYILSSAFLFAGAITVPPGLLSIMALLLVIPGFLRNRRRDRLLKDWFNASNYLLAVQIASIIMHSGGFDAHHFGPGALVSVLLAVAAEISLSTLLVAFFLTLNLGVPLRKLPIWDPRFLGADALVSAMGGLLGLVLLTFPWAAVLALIPLVLPYGLLQNMHLVRMVDVDPKTGLYNHRYFHKRLPELLARHRGRGRPVSVLFADLDYLREVNNTHGHLAGDQVLKQVADVMLRHTRPGDLLARWGGEEFVIVLPESDAALALSVAERLCDAIRNHPFDIGREEPIRCTISIGLASSPDHGWEPAELVHLADQAMYRAKAVGRDQACLAGRLKPETA